MSNTETAKLKADLDKCNAQLNVTSWILTALMRKHRYTQFSVTVEALQAIAESGVDVLCDDDSQPGTLIITLEKRKEQTIGDEEDNQEEPAGDGTDADNVGAVEAEQRSGDHSSSSDERAESLAQH